MTYIMFVRIKHLKDKEEHVWWKESEIELKKKLDEKSEIIEIQTSNAKKLECIFLV